MRCFQNGLIPLFFALAFSIGTAAAENNNDGGNSSDGDGGRSAEESWIQDHVRLTYSDGHVEKILRILLTNLRRESTQQSAASAANRPKQVLIDVGFVEVNDVNKLDLSGVPLFGSFIGPEFNARDMTGGNKVGNVFRTGNGGLFLALEPQSFGGEDRVDINRLILFNQDFSYEVKPLRLTEVSNLGAAEGGLGALAPLLSVRSVTTEVSLPDAGTILLGGLNQEDHRNDASQLPFLGDIPRLGELFAGTAHQADERTLLIMIKPSILADED